VHPVTCNGGSRKVPEKVARAIQNKQTNKQKQENANINKTIKNKN
jgi:hypothetical protein